MTGKLSRRKIAEYVAAQTRDGQVPVRVVQEVAAYLTESRRERELPLLVRSVEEILADQGVVVATVTTAHPLSEQLRAEVEAQIGADKTYLREVVDPSVVGGVRLQTPDASYDATLAHKLKALRGAKV